MKILLISTQDYIHHPIPSRHHYIFEELGKRGHEIHAAHFHVSRGDQRYTDLIIEEVTQFNFTSPMIHYVSNAPYHYYRFNQIIKKFNIDLVVGAHVLAGAAMIRAAHKNNIPVIFDLKDWFPDSAAAYFGNKLAQHIVRKSVWEITKNNLQHSNYITTVSPSLVKKLKKFNFESELIPNGVDTSLFKPLLTKNTWKKTLGINEEDYVIGFIGSIETWYGIDGLIKVMPELLKYNPNTKLLIVGDSLFTSYATDLKYLAIDLGVNNNVIFTGAQLYKNLPKYISCMNVCTIPLLPEKWRNIALPNKFFEYSACNKPILMTPMPDVEAMGEGNLFVYHNQKEYISQIKNLMRHDYKFFIDASKYDWKNRADNFEKVFNKVLANDFKKKNGF